MTAAASGTEKPLPRLRNDDDERCIGVWHNIPDDTDVTCSNHVSNNVAPPVVTPTHVGHVVPSPPVVTPTHVVTSVPSVPVVTPAPSVSFVSSVPSGSVVTPAPSVPSVRVVSPDEVRARIDAVNKASVADAVAHVHTQLAALCNGSYASNFKILKGFPIALKLEGALEQCNNSTATWTAFEAELEKTGWRIRHVDAGYNNVEIMPVETKPKCTPRVSKTTHTPASVASEIVGLVPQNELNNKQVSIRVPEDVIVSVCDYRFHVALNRELEPMGWCITNIDGRDYIITLAPLKTPATPVDPKGPTGPTGPGGWSPFFPPSLDASVSALHDCVIRNTVGDKITIAPSYDLMLALQNNPAFVERLNRDVLKQIGWKYVGFESKYCKFNTEIVLERLVPEKKAEDWEASVPEFLIDDMRALRKTALSHSVLEYSSLIHPTSTRLLEHIRDIESVERLNRDVLKDTDWEVCGLRTWGVVIHQRAK
jgi:hypothetical protein